MCKWILYLAELDQNMYSFLSKSLIRLSLMSTKFLQALQECYFLKIRILLFCHGSIYGHNKNVSLFEHFT